MTVFAFTAISSMWGRVRTCAFVRDKVVRSVKLIDFEVLLATH